MTKPAVLTPEEIAIDDLRRACTCLYLEVPQPIADDVTHKANVVILLAESLESKLRAAEGRIAHLEGAFLTAGVRYAIRHFYNRVDSSHPFCDDITRAVAAILVHETALQSTQKENE